ncbi:acetyl-CoA carboxylase biotin carboxyl carrier protein [Sharpea azabuensis]|uniref:Biotin carboxyl carrier protein of acetyl-CoA carboxylase n=1 Tax=Sharpea azabuensis TaxID=322505 RepID=A0A1H6S056_9FIRM|nr:acetyl-CoA carboxylase biotin carboxyl carrier protein [Sharpea azabuensis]HAJ15287.1 acetyl-CoA carboxylase biotin carboxyl carrier protein [Erysipelotrichaceae bacterium]MDD6512174.1 acetyl-CoA carboxylase biotin carboxyl carrier protein [Sharpea azabuensis]SEI61403.1 acetyl-CoA carboxylase biotin carboxyl carrier protein [Sharpea azabuensis]HAV18599.1 acetyl-CoA carboxylase biotin carboxyl carrier protein [Erysipelotrichaceae bacterium]HBG85350.1 acetyl-CoA carboxylase biotin carboxyl ca
MDKVKELMKAFEEANINKMKLEMHDLKLELEKSSGTAQKSIETRREETIEEKEPQSDILAYKVKSPLVGTFYASPSPDAKAYVQVGDHVTKGTTLCIIEAMKVMNEIKAPVNGVIQKILVQANDMVEYDQVLMTIEED